mmetsp:Transcript_7125/g.21250  ORF Transcript_7125/g.21250 Transcript_7125/m.21250 type:complete len:95 (-) Transcript_7125:175-459(-)
MREKHLCIFSNQCKLFHKICTKSIIVHNTTMPHLAFTIHMNRETRRIEVSQQGILAKSSKTPKLTIMSLRNTSDFALHPLARVVRPAAETCRFL